MAKWAELRMKALVVLDISGARRGRAYRNGQTFGLARMLEISLARFTQRSSNAASRPSSMRRRSQRLMMTETLAPPPFCSIAEARVRIVLTGKNRLFAAHKSL